MATGAGVGHLTRLSHIHPYPAMIANELAWSLAMKHAKAGRRFLDPFCGTARTVMASSALGMESVGLDVNPLAALVSRAKAADADISELLSLLARSKRNNRHDADNYELQPNRKVSWLSDSAQFELRQIITWINTVKTSSAARLVLATLLSATTREVSFCRKGQWKLHRMSLKERRLHTMSAWEAFRRRLTRTISELQNETGPRASAQIMLGDCTQLSKIRELQEADPFDLIITSPPYGDSRTTVSYGDVSALCLGVVQHIRGIQIGHINSRTLDNSCIGGLNHHRPQAHFKLKDYWAGGEKNEARMRSENFLVDLATCCREMNSVLAVKADVIFVVSRRSAGGRRLYIDEFLKDTFSDLGFSLKEAETRTIVGKMTPTVINARGASRDTLRVSTMRQELVLTFSRSR